MMGDLGPAVVATGLRKAFGAHVVLDNFTLELTVGSWWPSPVRLAAGSLPF